MEVRWLFDSDITFNEFGWEDKLEVKAIAKHNYLYIASI